MKACIVGIVADALRGTYRGGAEKQLALLAHALAARGHEVVCVAPAYDGPDERSGGLLLRSGWSPRVGTRVVRSFTYRLPNLRRVLADVRADLYYTRGFSLYAPVVVAEANRQGAVSVVGIAHDTDLDPGRGAAMAQHSSRYHRLLAGPLTFAYFKALALDGATRVGAQTREQLARCQALGMRAEIIPNIAEPLPDTLAQAPEDQDVAWVNTFARWKGVDRLLQVVDRLPDVSFGVAGRLGTPGLQPLVDELQQRPNVRLHGELPHGAVLDQLARSRVVLNTAVAEGFSNVFLEAWSLGKPVLALNVDPDSLLSSGELGASAGGDVARLADLLRQYVRDDATRAGVRARARAYVAETHAADAVCVRLERLVADHAPRLGAYTQHIARG